MPITIDYFKQTFEAVASNMEVLQTKLDSVEEKIKFQQQLLAALPPEKPSKFSLMFPRSKISEREQCIRSIHFLLGSKHSILQVKTKLEQLKLEADRFVESELNRHQVDKADVASKEKHVFESISEDQLSHAKAILDGFIDLVATEDYFPPANMGVASVHALKDEIESSIMQRRYKPGLAGR